MFKLGKSLRGRILIYMLFAALVPLVVLGYLAATLGESAVADTAGQKFVDFAQQSLDEINGALTQEMAKAITRRDQWSLDPGNGQARTNGPHAPDNFGGSRRRGTPQHLRSN